MGQRIPEDFFSKVINIHKAHRNLNLKINAGMFADEKIMRKFAGCFMCKRQTKNYFSDRCTLL